MHVCVRLCVCVCMCVPLPLLPIGGIEPDLLSDGMGMLKTLALPTPKITPLPDLLMCMCMQHVQVQPFRGAHSCDVHLHERSSLLLHEFSPLIPSLLHSDAVSVLQWFVQQSP